MACGLKDIYDDIKYKIANDEYLLKDCVLIELGDNEEEVVEIDVRNEENYLEADN